MNQTSIQGNIKQIGNYILESELGQGNFGKVYKALDKTTNSYYAVKRIDKKKINANSMLPNLLKTEIKIMKEIEHPNILHLFDYIESNTHFYLVLNYCNQGDLECYMKAHGMKYFEEEEALGLLKQTMNGFHELRKKKIIHRDFKLANIFMSDDVLVIGDFGLAKYGNDLASTMCGTPMTMAPELLFPDYEKTALYNSKADIWSIGVVYYQLLFGEPPYTGLETRALYNSMKEKTGDKLVFLRKISEESKDVLRKMLTMDAEKRINWKELFEHPVFNKHTAMKPTLVNGMTKIMQSFFGSKAKPMLDPSQQFALNKVQVDSVDNVPYVSLDKVDPASNVPVPQHFEEKPIDPSLENKILQEMALREITYTFNHERNKLLFLVFTVKHIQWALTSPKFAIYADPFFQISLLILKKSKVLNDGLIFNLSNGVNIFRINEQFWNLYKQSPHIMETKSLFLGLSALLQEYFDLVYFRTNENGINAKFYEQFLTLNNPDLARMDQAMIEEKNKIQAIKQADQNVLYDPSHSSKMTCLEKLIETSTYSEQNLKYIKMINGVPDKFKMDLFYKAITQNQGTPFY